MAGVNALSYGQSRWAQLCARWRWARDFRESESIRHRRFPWGSIGSQPTRPTIWSSSVHRSRPISNLLNAVTAPEACAQMAAPLLKPTIARAGDVVSVSAAGIAVNGKMIPRTAPRTSDSKGRKLQPWPTGQYLVGPGTVWVASAYNEHSYDSRYFGPVPTSTIRYRLRPVCTLYSYDTGAHAPRSR